MGWMPTDLGLRPRVVWHGPLALKTGRISVYLNGCREDPKTQRPVRCPNDAVVHRYLHTRQMPCECSEHVHSMQGQFVAMDTSARWQTMARRLGLGAALLWVLSLAYTALPVLAYGVAQGTSGGLLTNGLDLLINRPPLDTFTWTQWTLTVLPIPASCLIGASLWGASTRTYRTMAWWLTALSVLVALILVVGFANYVYSVYDPKAFPATEGEITFGLTEIRIGFVCLTVLTLPWRPNLAFLAYVVLTFANLVSVTATCRPDPTPNACEGQSMEEAQRLASAKSAALAMNFDVLRPTQNTGRESKQGASTKLSFEIVYLALAVFGYQWDRKKSATKAAAPD